MFVARNLIGVAFLNSFDSVGLALVLALFVFACILWILVPEGV